MKERPAENKQAFLFINKDQQSRSLSKSEGVTAKQINRHAQQIRNQRLEAQKVSSARQSSSAARRIALGGWSRREADDSPCSDSPTSAGSPGYMTPLSISSCTPLFRAIPHGTPTIPNSTQQSQLIQTSSKRSAALTGHMGGDDEEEFSESSIVIDFSPNLIYRATFSTNTFADPFAQTPVKIDDQLNAFLQYILRMYTYSANNYKIAHLPPHLSASISRFPIDLVVQRSVFKEHHLYSLLAAMSARLLHLFGQSSIWSRPERFRAIAIYHLKKELISSSRTGQVDKHTLLDILWLAVNEVNCNRFNAARKYLMIVGKLYHLLDLNQHFDHWISETCAHVDNQLALASGARPVLPQSFDPGQMLPERMATLQREVRQIHNKAAISSTFTVLSPMALVPKPPQGLRDIIADLASNFDLRMGSKFDFGLKIGIFDAKMARIVQDLVVCIGIAKVVWLSPLAVGFDAEWLCRKARSVLRALLSITPVESAGPMDLSGACMESARVSLLIMMSHACTLMGFQCAKSNTKRLKEAMKNALEAWCPAVGWDTECKPNHDLPVDESVSNRAGFVLFSAMIGVFAAQDTADEEWFIIRAINLCQTIELHNFEDLQNHMQCFLYSKTLQSESVRRVGQRVELESTKRHQRLQLQQQQEQVQQRQQQQHSQPTSPKLQSFLCPVTTVPG